MCYNCGCGIPDDDMGYGKVTQNPKGGALTEEDLIELAKRTNTTLEDTKKEIYKLLKKQLDN